MANWTNVEMSVLLETGCADQFLAFFDSNARQRFYRTFIESVSRKEQDCQYTLIKITCSCAWSAHASFLGGKRISSDGVVYMDLEDVIKACKIKALILYAKETGIGFEESFEYEAVDECVRYKARDLFPDPDEIEYITGTAPAAPNQNV